MSASSLGRKFDGKFGNFQGAVEDAYTKLDEKPRYKQMFYIVKNGNFEIKDWVVQLKLPKDEEVVIKAA